MAVAALAAGALAVAAGALAVDTGLVAVVTFSTAFTALAAVLEVAAFVVAAACSLLVPDVGLTACSPPPCWSPSLFTSLPVHRRHGPKPGPPVPATAGRSLHLPQTLPKGPV